MKLIVLQKRKIFTLAISNTLCKIICSTFANKVIVFANKAQSELMRLWIVSGGWQRFSRLIQYLNRNKRLLCQRLFPYNQSVNSSSFHLQYQ